MMMIYKFNKFRITHTFLGGKVISQIPLEVCPKDFVTWEHCVIDFWGKNEIHN